MIGPSSNNVLYSYATSCSETRSCPQFSMRRCCHCCSTRLLWIVGKSGLLESKTTNSRCLIWTRITIIRHPGYMTNEHNARDVFIVVVQWTQKIIRAPTSELCNRKWPQLTMTSIHSSPSSLNGIVLLRLLSEALPSWISSVFFH